MSEPTYIERLRAIRDRIGEELQRTDWQQWEAQARRNVRRDPKLARLLEQAEGPADAAVHASQRKP